MGMIMKKLLSTALMSSALAFTAPAQAAVIASLTFNAPTGAVASNAAIDVFLTLTLDANSDALTTDATGKPTSGFDYAGYTGPIDLNDPNTRVIFNESFGCSGTFVDGCGGGSSAYEWNFNFNQPNFIGPVDFNLQPGQSFSWLFGTFTPIGGNAAAGLYTFYNASTLVQIYNPGADPNDPNDDQRDFINFAQTCPTQEASCAFTREVFAANNAVPEPGTWGMMILGFGVVGSALRRRGATRALTAMA
jgi:PEP-CTERM motif